MRIKKRSKQRVIVGPKMLAVAGQQTGSPRQELPVDVRASEKAALFEELAHTLARTSAGTEEEESKSIAVPESVAGNQTAELIQLLADITTGLWRLRAKMLVPGATQPAEENRRSFKQLESISDILMQAGVQIRDHTGEAVPRGGIYTLKALAYEPTAGLAREQVIETLKPTIAFKDRVIQIGEVIIGTPLIAD